MKVFHCDHCGALVFFENVVCLSCGAPLAYLPDLGVVASLEAAEGHAGEWATPIPRAAGRRYKKCQNYTEHNVCNWALPADSPDALCQSCDLTRVIPDLTVERNKERWYKLEVAKRRLSYTLLGLGLPLTCRRVDPEGGLAFEFLADTPDAGPVLTGHDNGLITLNIAEADDDEREKRRVQLGEPYRTLVGHFRHEVGHYYWNVLVRDDPKVLERARELFGDDREDYGKALKRHYANGPRPDWQAGFISSYAAAHAWEDWAETWAHYLHMVDTLETAADCGVTLRPVRHDLPTLKKAPDPIDNPSPFRKMIDAWYPLTYMLNNLNRGLGTGDAYPFVLSPPVEEKLRFIHEVVAARAGTA